MNIHHLNQTFRWHTTVECELIALLKREQREKGITRSGANIVAKFKLIILFFLYSASPLTSQDRAGNK